MTVVAYAIIVSNFKTVMTVATVPLIYLFYNQKSKLYNLHYDWFVFKKSIPIIFVLITIITPLAFIHFFGINQIKVIHPDYIFYARASDYIGEFKESYYFDVYNPQLISYRPYHYFELWLTNLVYRITGLNSLKLLLLSIYPIFFTLSCLGILSICQFNKINITIWIALLSIVILFFNGITYDIYKYLPYEIFKPCWEINYSFFLTFQKQSIIFVFLVFVYLLYKLKSDTIYAITCLIPVFYFTTYPVVFGILGSILIYRFIKSRQLSIINDIIIFSVSAFGILLFYKIVNLKTTSSFNFSNILTQFLDSFELILKTDVHILIQYSILFSPFIILVIIYRKQSDLKILIYVLFGILFWGLNTYNLMIHVIDSNQLYSNILTSYTYLLVVVIFLEFYVSKKIIPILVISCFIFLKTFSGLNNILSHRNYLPENFQKQLIFENKIKNHIKNHSKVTIGYVSNENDLDGEFEKNTYLTVPLVHIVSDINHLSIVNLSNFRQKNLSTFQDFELHENSVINNFIDKNHYENKSEEIIISTFIKRYRIKYVLIRTSDPFYQKINSFVVNKIYSPSSEFTFVELKNSYFN
ncbi:MAG: hypothetical protein U0V72_02230 [Cytophagales bacterium]